MAALKCAAVTFTLSVLYGLLQDLLPHSAEGQERNPVLVLQEQCDAGFAHRHCCDLQAFQERLFPDPL